MLNNMPPHEDSIIELVATVIGVLGTIYLFNVWMDGFKKVVLWGGLI